MSVNQHQERNACAVGCLTVDKLINREVSEWVIFAGCNQCLKFSSVLRRCWLI